MVRVAGNATASVSACVPSSDDPEAEEEITALPGQKRCVSAHLTVPMTAGDHQHVLLAGMV